MCSSEDHEDGDRVTRRQSSRRTSADGIAYVNFLTPMKNMEDLGDPLRSGGGYLHSLEYLPILA